MTNSTPIRKNDGSGQLNGSIGNGKVDVPTPSPVAPKEVESFTPPSGTIESQTLAIYERFKDRMAPATPEEEAAIAELRDFVEGNTNVSPFAEEAPVSTRLRISERLPFQRYSSFNSTVLALTDELFKARPSSLTPEARAELYQKWINDASVAYGLPSIPEIVWDNSVTKPGYNVEANWLYLNPEKPYILKLLNGFRIAQLALGNATTLPSQTEATYSPADYNYSACDCGEIVLGQGDNNNGDVCASCHTPVIARVDEHMLPSNVEARNYQRDALTWSESLFYTSRPVLFERQAREGRLGRHATGYFLNLQD